ncbi:MAG: NUDIX domain-containing protein [Chloroflexi bacterium]|nr:NUDIX domain-containing protein [Chloroflexota bacterium]MBI1855388.1 NUDIX domain-containing protein [Chloroflexota bacterium]MBI3341254.1 NUDIX domain-containing protein [Chloroflexota bacterium]
MTQVFYGDRIGKGAELRIGSCAVIFDETRTKVLLTKRMDNGLWCLPGGKMESGESVEECCAREVFEETGLEVRTRRLIGVYSNHDLLVVYPDGKKVQIVVLSFEAKITGGKLGLSDETTEAGFYALTEIEQMPMHGRHKERILDALEVRQSPVVQ